MGNKSTTLKNYLKDIGTNNQLFFLFGNTPTTVSSNTDDQAIDVWKNSSMSYRVARKDSVAVVPNVTWSSGNIYTSWSSYAQNTGNYYAWNKTNGIVYLCVSNNDLNRTDLEGTVNSTEVPSHSAGLKKYPDGYTWLPLYKITADLLRFVNTSWIPVISFDDYRTTETSRYSKAQSFCTNNQNQTGYCGVYTKTGYQIPDGTSSFENFSAGALISTLQTTCYDCYYLFENDDRFISKFYTSTPASTIQVMDKFDEIADLVSRNAISPSSPYYALYNISANGLADGAIVSAIIDLSEFTSENLVVTESNPSLTIASNSGSNGAIRLKTYKNADGENIVEGIEVVSNGQDYKDISVSISYSKFPYLTSTQVDALMSAIEINVDTLDGLNFDPVSALSAEHIVFDIRIETNYLKQNSIEIPDEINFYGLVENPLEEIDSATTIVAGSQYAKDLSYIEPNTVKLDTTLYVSPTKNTGLTTATTTTGKQITNMSIISTVSKTRESVGSPGDYEQYYEISTTGSEYNSAPYINSIKVGNDVYAIQNVTLPPIKQYTGKVAQAKKLSSPLLLGTESAASENTRIFRINIVKGF
jgi:hypothetical protein